MGNIKNEEKIKSLTPQEFRLLVRKGEWKERTTNILRNYAQFNLVVVPKEYAFDFLLFCLRNPQACPVVDITDVGNTEPTLISSSSDIRTDLPKYRVFKNGEIVEEPMDIIKYWNKDLVGFLLGTAMGVLDILTNMHIPWRNFGGYKTSIPCSSAGRFKSHLVVTAIAFKNSNDAVKAIQISSRFPAMHGAPMHIGKPESIGIKDLKKPDTFIPKNEMEPLHPEEILIYWGCGVTPQVAALESKVPFIITHSPGHFLVSDKLVEEFSTL